jgi:hypothetical protein
MVLGEGVVSRAGHQRQGAGDQGRVGAHGANNIPGQADVERVHRRGIDGREVDGRRILW